MYAAEQPPDATFYHGTRANLGVGDTVSPGFNSNFGKGAPASWVYFSATLDAAIWGAELAQGAERERIYIVRPTGPFVDDPNLTDKKFAGNLTKSYRSRAPLKIIGVVQTWKRHAPDVVQHMKDNVERARQAGVEAID